MFIYFLGVHFVNLMFFTIYLSPNIMIGLTIASGVLLIPNLLRDNIPLKWSVDKYNIYLCLNNTNLNFETF